MQRDYDILKGRYYNDTQEATIDGKAEVFREILATIDDFERAKVKSSSRRRRRRMTRNRGRSSCYGAISGGSGSKKVLNWNPSCPPPPPFSYCHDRLDGLQGTK